ncbi:mannose-6-phosphate isomerase, type 1 [Granulicella rosea]|uniref:Mannose-6-phosphate isomerase, type 1 n=1 Tax=Granulicella rosea TaxID=474952 RepID=A0A239IT06_9BACT|nr:type I phosphomannose isomerase catalytic subunit [Granulicella rosea]SNS96709.1 mannose-6-phosphate isomerase, type 1 [Granulicella rosea]
MTLDHTALGTGGLAEDFSDIRPVDAVLMPFRLAPVFSKRIWGKPDLKPWYASTGTDELVGEAWLTGPDCIVETGPFTGQTLAAVAAQLGTALLGPASQGEFPLLIKILFPNDKLSVQVHPNDAQAQAMGVARGKTECWYVLEAEPGATVALGLKPGVDVAALGAAAKDNTMESLIEQVPVKVGDMVFVDAGTVHAIGPGVVLLETQQTCDVTYRLYDYGRPRELHLEAGLAVTSTSTKAGKIAPVAMHGFTRLIDQQYFIVDRFEGAMALDAVGASCLVSLKGTATVTAHGASVEMPAGQAVIVPAGLEVSVAGEDIAFVRCSEPA